MELGVKEYVLLGVFVVLLACGWKLYHAGAKTALATATAQSLTKAATIKEKQDAIRNNRPDDAAFIKRLRQHTY